MNLRVAAFGKLRPLWTAVPGAGRHRRWSALVGAAAMIEMLYHLQLNERARARADASGRHARRQRRRQLVRRRRRAAGRRWRCSSWRGASFMREWGAIAGRDRRRDQAPGGALHERADSRSNCATCARASARPRSSAAPTWRCARRARGHHRPQRRRQVDAVQPDQRAASAPRSGEILLNGERIDGLKPYEINRRGLSRSFQVTNLFPRLSVFENLRCAVLWSLGYRYSFWQLPGRPARRQRARRGGAGA